MTKREYAISLGLAKAGRGRLSKEAHAAIADAERNGMVFSDGTKAVSVTQAMPKKKQAVKRLVKSYVLTTTMGQVIAFENCAFCKQNVQYCNCHGGPSYPDWISSEVDTWLPADPVVG